MTNEQKFIAANAAYIEELIRDVDRLEKSRDYVTNELNRERNKMVAAEKELKEAQVKNLDLEFELEDMQKQLKQLNGPDVAELRKEIRQLRDQNDELTRMCAPDPDIPERHVKTADEISQWCRWYGDCDTCNHMQIDDGGNRECDLEIYGYEPFCWSSHVIATLDRIMTFDETTKKNTNKETKNE